MVAFTNPADGTVAIVVVNGGGAQNVSFFVSGKAWPASVTPYVTTDQLEAGRGDGHHGHRGTVLRLPRRAVGHDVRRQALGLSKEVLFTNELLR